MRHFIYKAFTWLVLIITASLATFFTGFVFGAVVMNDAHEKVNEKKRAETNS